jgi:hypothetical protein
MNAILAETLETGSVSTDARIFLFTCGIVLALWVILGLRKRRLLVSLSLLFFTFSLGFLLFAIFPSLFNQTAYLVGIKYPPLLYLIAAIISFLILAVHFASRLSLVDERCRRLAQEIALVRAMSEEQDKGR